MGAGSANSPVYEIWDPSTPDVMPTTLPVNTAYLASVKQNYYPFNFVLPTGDMFNFCGRCGRTRGGRGGHVGMCVDVCGGMGVGVGMRA